MKCAGKGDELVATGVVASQFHRGFVGFGARITEIHFVRALARRDCSQFFCQLDHVFVVEVRAGHVDQALGLLLDRLYHPGMAMAGRCNGDSGVEIEETVAVYVLDHRAFSARRHQWITACIRGRKYFAIAPDQLCGAGAGQSGNNLWKVQTDHFSSNHGSSPSLNLLWATATRGKGREGGELVGAEQAGAGCGRSRHNQFFIVAI
jgi:hypothetical protein